MEAGKEAAKGIELGKQRKLDESLKEFDKALRIYNNDAAKAYHNKGWVCELKGDVPGAISNYEEALKRNPVQIPTMERAGYLYFQTGRFDEAVSVGEQVIRIDPKNTEVIKWLPEAYTMRLKKQREMLLAKQEEEKKKKEEEKAAKSEEEKKEKEKQQYLYATLDFMLRTGYYYKDVNKSKGYHYISSPGYYINVPDMLHVDFTPTSTYEFDLLTGHPYYGALMPNVLSHFEKLEAIINMGKYSLGLGEILSHYDGSFAFADGKNRNIYDFKTGLIFGFRKEDADILIRFYPRFLPRVDSNSTGKDMDIDFLKINYNYRIDKLLLFYSWFSANDFYYFDNDAKISNYLGEYELGFGITLGKYKDLSKLQYLSVSIDYTERFYLRDFNNPHPYKFGNGQGWFGLNTGKWFKGHPFSGYYTDGHVLSAKVEEGITENIFLYQGLIIEIVNAAGDHDEFNLLFGIGGTY